MDRPKASLDVHQLPTAGWLRWTVADLRTGAAVSAGRTPNSRRRDRRQGVARGRTASVRLL